ncbi:DUF1392 domain-containing protein (plasmid) [Anabaena sp. FACHB-709]|uniref:DUF1392 domain-containing protein n=1 Tax=Anabaena cylindrica FACHB-318 TaxID=2692880 RepID=A0ABR7ZRZ3_ANACY|nr:MULTISPECIES: DUF1392 domain-containing protein [Nostocaceae]MBD2174988.1 DUF1392 domain-containing protein [Anabaena cylindrica FACHB-318]MBD2266656.1 DUF1392 domain-containing protein [Anabaena sp. FACHB-709]MBD2276250.1 DUF1392 domain-containing protein [Nostoc sp. PCC 7120 = FACHB-418]MBD2287213.1 DUF1392 domain-containing protein [Anabaena cylindrica FACHB-170]MBD2352698.1 DUF1392 domain-containing protein [Trichormus variabilis FACHB-171]
MTEQIAEIERCWYLSPPWGGEMPPVEIQLWEKVYLKSLETFGYCYGIQWYQDCWHYIIEITDDAVHATKHQIIGTGRFKPTNLQKPAFALGDRVIFASCSAAPRQRLVLGVALVRGELVYLIETISPTLPQIDMMPRRFSLVKEADLVRVMV